LELDARIGLPQIARLYSEELLLVPLLERLVLPRAQQSRMSRLVPFDVVMVLVLDVQSSIQDVVPITAACALIN
jgi:hypothetical protein